MFVGRFREHLEPDWAVLDLLELVEVELISKRRGQRPSRAELDAIRMLPISDAGDLFVTRAARGDISVILFYFDEGRR